MSTCVPCKSDTCNYMITEYITWHDVYILGLGIGYIFNIDNQLD